MEHKEKIQDKFTVRPDYRYQTAFLGSKTQPYYYNEKKYGTFIPKYEYNLALKQEGFNCSQHVIL